MKEVLSQAKSLVAGDLVSVSGVMPTLTRELEVVVLQIPKTTTSS